MAFTEIEMAILSQAAYLKLPDSAEPKSLYTFLNDSKKMLLEALGEGYKNALDALLKKVKGKGYNIVQTQNDKYGTGFAAFAVADPNNEVTVACRGTEGFSLDYDSKKDVKSDVELAVSLQTGQQEQMKKFVERLEKQNYKGYSFTGHSLGGNLAMYGAIILSNPNKLTACVTFNAPGFNDAFLVSNAFRISRIEDKMTSFQNERDCVSECFNVPGNIVILECKGWDLFHFFGIDAHGMGCLVPSNSGENFKRNHTGRKDKTILGYILDKGTDTTNVFFTPFIFASGFSKWRKKEAKAICRDFSVEAKAMLIEAAKETEEEKWWQISRWDCWYKVDKFFGGLSADWDRYSGNVDKYYRKLIDMNDASTKDIEKIFNNVYNLDTQYANEVKGKCDDLHSTIRAKLEKIRDSIYPTYVHNNTTFSTVEFFQQYADKQDLSGNCTSTAWCMGLSMMTGKKYDPTKPPYWGPNGAVYHGYDKITSNQPLLVAYDELQKGKPSMFYAYNGNRISGKHAVTIVGVTEGADRNNLQPQDFLVIDPGDGKIKNMTEVGFINYNGTIYTYKDNP